MTKVSVVIPFFQESEGLLKDALLSVLNQKTTATIQAIIVDDGSPVSARSEVRDFYPTYSKAIVVIEQKNAGPGAARNTGLDHVEKDTDFVAFLDSDDVWTESHLERALWALGSGYDFYFSDFYQVDQSVTAFHRAKRIRMEEHRRIHPQEPIHEYQGDMVNQVICGNVLGTPTVVYNFKKFSAIRYPEDFRHAGEDYIFWIRLASATNRIAFSSEPECRCGRGVNIYAQSGWGTDKYLRIVHDDLKYRKYLSTMVKLTNSQKAFVRTKLNQLRCDFAKGFLHNLISNRSVDQALLWRHFRLDPLTFFAVPFLPGVVMYEKLRRFLSA